MPSPPRPRTGQLRRSGVLGIAAAAGLLLLWAAAAPRPPEVIPGLKQGQETTQLGGKELHGFTSPIMDWDLRYTSQDLPDWLAATIGGAIIAMVAAAALTLLVLLARALLRMWRERSLPPPADARSSDVVPAAVLADQAERLEALASGTPAEGIVAAWARLEASIAIAGVPLLRSRTSTEVVLATLRSHEVSEEVLEDLAALFREARFSSHPLTEHDRVAAERALRRIDAELEMRLGLSTGDVDA